MKVTTLKRLLHVFGEDGSETVTIDRIVLVLSPMHPVARGSIQRERIKSKASHWALHHDARMERVDGRRCFLWTEQGGIGVQQFVGDWLAGDRRVRVSQVVEANPLRALARRYTEQGRVRPYVGEEKRNDNFVPPHSVAPVQVSRDTFAFIQQLVNERVDAYCRDYEVLLGRPVARDQIRVTIKEIELTWDRTCEAASFAPIAFWKPWQLRFGDSTFNARGPFLTAMVAKGERYKLYAKAHRVLRFEACLSRSHARRLLGHRLDPREPCAFEADLRRLAELLYPQILDVQEEVVPQWIVDFRPALNAVLRSRAKPVLRVLEGFLSSGRFKKGARDESAGRLLRFLKAAGLAEQVRGGKGLWAPRKELELLLRLVEWRTLSLGAGV